MRQVSPDADEDGWVVDGTVEERGDGAWQIEHVLCWVLVYRDWTGKSQRLDRCLGNRCMLFDDLPLPLLGWFWGSSAVASVDSGSSN